MINEQNSELMNESGEIMNKTAQYRIIEKVAVLPKRVGKHNIYVVDLTDPRGLRESARLRVSAANKGREISDKILNQYAKKHKSLKRVPVKRLGVTHPGKPHQTPIAFVYKNRIERSADSPINRLLIRGGKKKRYRKLLRDVVEHEKFHIDHKGGIGKSELLAHTIGGLKNKKRTVNIPGGLAGILRFLKNKTIKAIT